MRRNILVTGAASGIGREVCNRLRANSDNVIAADLHDAEISIDLSTHDGRLRLIEEADGFDPQVSTR